VLPAAAQGVSVEEYIDWCINGMLASPHMETIFDGLCVFAQISLWIRLTFTSLIL
jgi:hypothetical protein